MTHSKDLLENIKFCVEGGFLLMDGPSDKFYHKVSKESIKLVSRFRRDSNPSYNLFLVISLPLIRCSLV